MVQATESRKGLNLVFIFRANCYRPSRWRVLRESEMSPVLVIGRDCKYRKDGARPGCGARDIACSIDHGRLFVSEKDTAWTPVLSVRERRALTISEFRERLRDGNPCELENLIDELRRRAFVSESLNIFRQFPFLQLDADRALILDLQFLIELLTS